MEFCCQLAVRAICSQPAGLRPESKVSRFLYLVDMGRLSRYFWSIMVSEDDSAVKEALVHIARHLYERQMLVGTEGNISVRLDSDRILITPSGVCKGSLSAEDLVVVDRQGRQISGRGPASSELLMHLFVYDCRPEITGCVHSHPPYATAFAVAGVPLAGDILPEMVLLVGDVPLTEYASPGTEEVPRSLEPYVADNDAFLLRSHGLLTVGRTLEEAFIRHETVEHGAQIVWLAQHLGPAGRIPRSDVERLVRLRRAARQAD